MRKQTPRGILKKSAHKICSKFTGEHPCRSVISIKLQSNFIEVTLRHGRSNENLPHIFKNPFLRTPLGRSILIMVGPIIVLY